MTVCRPDLELVVKLYGSVLPDYGYILRRCESEQRWIRFSPRLYEFVAQIQCQGYPILYQDEARIQSVLLRAIFPNDEEIHQALRELTSASSDEQQRLFNELVQDSIDLGEWLEDNLVHLDDLDWSPADRAKAELEWAKLTPEEQQKTQRSLPHLISFGLATFFNYFALMVHGRKLTQLVREAIAGTDESFYLAVHIDKSIL